MRQCGECADQRHEAHRARRAVTAFHQLQAALRAKELFKRDKDYVVMNGEVLIVDEHTGRMLAGRRYNEGMHQAIEAKEGVEIKNENQTLATITLQNYFRLYDKLGGMTGTAATEAAEFSILAVGPLHAGCEDVDHLISIPGVTSFLGTGHFSGPESYLPGVASGDTGGLARIQLETTAYDLGVFKFVPRLFVEYGMADVEEPLVGQPSGTQSIADGGVSLAHTTSWGMTTRMIGAGRSS